MVNLGDVTGERRLRVGDVVSAKFPAHNPQRHEQEGYRPAVVVGLPDRVGTARFPIVLLVPMTSHEGQAWAEEAPRLYPRYGAGIGGLHSDSICLLDQVRALSSERVHRYHGSLSEEEYQPIREGLEKILGTSFEVVEESRSEL